MSTLLQEMKSAAASPYTFLCEAPGTAPYTAYGVWQNSLEKIIAKAMEWAIQLGREHRVEIEQAARGAIDALVEFDIPGLPPIVESAIDSATRALGYQAVEGILDAILSETIASQP